MTYKIGVDYSDTLALYYFNKHWADLSKARWTFINTKYSLQIHRIIDHDPDITPEKITRFMEINALRLKLTQPPEDLK